MNENMKTRAGLIKLTILFAVSTLFIGCGGFIKKVYEMKTVSMGSCENINSVINAILDGMFKDFPGENGEVNSTLNPREQIGGC